VARKQVLQASMAQQKSLFSSGTGFSASLLARAQQKSLSVFLTGFLAV
jgi:hypothetical protein